MILVLSFIVFLTSCDYTEAWVNHLPASEKELYDQIGSDQFPEADFIRIQQIFDYLKSQADYENILHFLRSSRVRQNSYHFRSFIDYLLAFSYHEYGQKEIAVFLLQKLLNEGIDLIYRGNSLQPKILEYLSQQTSDPFDRLRYLKQLLAYQTNEQTNILLSYQLGKTYEEIGFWDQSIDTYRYTLSLPSTSEVLSPEIYSRIKSLVAYRNRTNNFISRDLNMLIQLVKKALSDGDLVQLSKLQSGSDFIIQYWAQKQNYHPPPEQETFLRGLIQFSRNYNGEMTVKWEEGLNEMSNLSEVFVKTTNWYAEWITVYFYFRKIFYPPNPAIHGLWEWSGVYLGGR